MSINIIEQITSQIDIVDIISEYIDLSKKGKNYWGICPFHDDSNPSMSVSSEKQLYNCFSCGAAGGVIKFVQEFEKIDFKSALRKLASKLDIEISEWKESKKYSKNEEELINVFEDAMNFYRISIESQEGTAGMEYANKRGLTPIIREKFNIGYASENNDLLKYLKGKKGHDEAALINASLQNSYGKEFYKNRLIFGIENEFGDIVAFSGRSINNEEPKYINSAESLIFKKTNLLYNYHNAKTSAEKNKKIYIVEGFMDVIAFSKEGIENVVALMGTSLTKKHIDKLKKYEITIMLDNDQAGLNATIKMIKLLLSNKIDVFVINNESNLDPDELQQQKLLLSILENKNTALEFIYRLHLKKFDIKTADGMNKMIQSLNQYLELASSNEVEILKSIISKELNISKELFITNNNNNNKTYNIINNNTYKQYNKKTLLDYKKPTYKFLWSMLKSKEFKHYYSSNRKKIDDLFLDPNASNIATIILNVDRVDEFPKSAYDFMQELIDFKFDGDLTINDAKTLENSMKHMKKRYNDIISKEREKNNEIK